MTGFLGNVGAGAATGVGEVIVNPAKSAKSLFEDGAGFDAGGLEIKANADEGGSEVAGGADCDINPKAEALLVGAGAGVANVAKSAWKPFDEVEGGGRAGAKASKSA